MGKIVMRFMVCCFIVYSITFAPHAPLCKEVLALETTSNIPAAPDDTAIESDGEDEGYDGAPDQASPPDEENGPSDEETIDEN